MMPLCTPSVTYKEIPCSHQVYSTAEKHMYEEYTYRHLYNERGSQRHMYLYNVVFKPLIPPAVLCEVNFAPQIS
jgi:hypothetical protein